jgi:hypothetical protein
MNRFNIKVRFIIIILCTGLFMTACAAYYEVRDPTTGSIYYTERVYRHDSVARFTDARSGAEVTIENSEIKKISKHEFDSGRVAPISKPTPALSETPAPNRTPASPDQSAAP